jgi:hypothetical protein
MGQENVDRRLTALGYGKMAASLRAAVLADDARSRS